MTKEKALYQVKLILDNLDKEEYNLIPKEDIDYIYENMEYSDDIKINPDIPLEEQEIDEKAYDYLEKIINKIEKEQSNKKEFEKMYEGYSEYDFIKEIEKYKIQNQKNKEIKKLVQDYKILLDNQNEQIKKIKENNELLYNSIKKCPKVIRKIFFKEFESKLLK